MLKSNKVYVMLCYCPVTSMQKSAGRCLLVKIVITNKPHGIAGPVKQIIICVKVRLFSYPSV